MRGFGQCVLIFLLFFTAVTAAVAVDRRCREMTGRGGSITAFADRTAAAAILH